MPEVPLRGQVWWVDLGHPLGQEAGYERPAVVISDERQNRHGLITVCPITRTQRDYPTRVEIDSPQSGLMEVSYIQAEQLRTVSAARLARRAGTADAVIMARVAQILRYLLAL